MPTSARQSSTRSLSAPVILGLAVVFTKVPLAQPAADNRGILPDVEAGGRVAVVVGVVRGVAGMQPYLTTPAGQGGRVAGAGGVVVGVAVAVGVLVRWQATGL